MLGLLSQILCWIKAAATGVLWALVSGVNLLVAGVGAFASAVVALLPAMPDTPPPLDSGVIGFVNYMFPLGGVVALLGVFLTIWLGYLVVRIPLRWVKAL